MAQARAIVLSASIDNEAAIGKWLASVREATKTAQGALDNLAALLQEGAHISITLHRTPPIDDPDGGRRGD